MKKLLVAIENFNIFKSIDMSIFKELDIEVEYNLSGSEKSYWEEPDLFSDSEYIIAGLEKYDEVFFQKFSKVKAISRVGVGTDNIDIQTAKSKGVKIFKTSDKPSVAVAELCIANMISILRSTFLMSNELKQGDWKPIVGREIRNLEIGIIGMGSIGKQIVKRLSVFETKLSGYGRTWDIKFANQYGVLKKSLKEIFSSSDIISIHLPLDEDTRGLINSDLISSMKSNSILINTSRSAVIDNIALSQALRAYKISGAAIDVFDEERNIAPYESINNVILTPHIGSHTRETRKEMEETSVNNIINYHKLITNSSQSDVNHLIAEIDKNTVI